MPVKSRYQTVKLETNGGSYESRSVPMSAQRSFNLYPESTPQAISPTVMRSWAGLRVRNIQFNTAPIIGCYEFKGDFYAVSGIELRKYSFDLTSFEVVGEITAAVGARASISDNGEVMIICAGNEPYIYDGSTVTQITGLDSKISKVQFLNERFYLMRDDGGVSVSDVLSTNFDAGNTFYGRSTTDQTITLHIFNQIIYLFDSDSVEPWQDVGTGAPPVSRINQGIIEGVGCSSVFGVTATDKYMYFMGSDGHAYRVNGFSSEDITNPVIANHFRGLNVSNVSTEFVSIDGHKFILFTFPSDKQTWVFSETSGAWFEVGTEDEIYQPISFVFYKSRWYCGDRESGTIYSLETDYFFNGIKRFKKERIISTVSGDDIGEPGVMLEMSKIRLSIETGATSGVSSKTNPEFALIPSFDGGYTFGRAIIIDMGDAGDFTIPVEVHMMQQFRRAVFKIRVTDLSDSFTIYSASIDIRKAGY